MSEPPSSFTSGEQPLGKLQLDDERRPKGKDGKPKAGKPYKRDFGVPEPKAQDSCTDPQARIMKRAGGL